MGLAVCQRGTRADVPHRQQRAVVGEEGNALIRNGSSRPGVVRNLDLVLEGRLALGRCGVAPFKRTWVAGLAGLGGRGSANGVDLQRAPINYDGIIGRKLSGGAEPGIVGEKIKAERLGPPTLAPAEVVKTRLTSLTG